MVNIYFDTEFTGLVPETTLISIGMVADDGSKFYGEFTDYRRDLCDEWIRRNVIPHCVYQRSSISSCGEVKWLNISNHNAILGEDNLIWRDDAFQAHMPDAYTEYIPGENCRFCFGESVFIRGELKEWLKHFGNQYIQLVSDVCHYDMYLLCNLFGGALKLPSNVNPVCYDICQDLCAKEKKRDGTINWYADVRYMRDAFDISRERACELITGSVPSGVKHNSLHDAIIIKAIYEGMRKK